MKNPFEKVFLILALVLMLVSCSKKTETITEWKISRSEGQTNQTEQNKETEKKNRPKTLDPFFLENVDEDCIGVYIPVDEENVISTRRMFYEAVLLGYPVHHDVLFLGEHKCYSDAGFHDGYAINAEEFYEFKFIENAAGKICIDNKGNSYKKISGNLNERGYGYTEYTDYVMKLLLAFVTDMNTVKILDGKVTLDDKTYSVTLDGTFLEYENIAIVLYDNQGSYALEKNGYNGELKRLVMSDNEFSFHADDEVIKEFPLMFLPVDRDLPFTSILPKEQYRYLRNLVFARHGYIFKSDDLKSYFEKFSWYKPDPNFSEDKLSREEKRYIERMLSYEEQ